MTTYKPTAITTDRKDSDSSVQRELSYPNRHAVFRVTQWKLPRPIKYDRKCGRLTTRFQHCGDIAISTMIYHIQIHTGDGKYKQLELHVPLSITYRRLRVYMQSTFQCLQETENISIMAHHIPVQTGGFEQ